MDKAATRNTQQRQVVLETLREMGGHPTAAELYEVARRRLPKISLGTVYRNLEFLAKNGDIRKLLGSGTEARFDACLDPHYHVRCIQCGRVDNAQDLPIDPVGTVETSVEGYEICGHHFELSGICPECRQKAGVDDGDP